MATSNYSKLVQTCEPNSLNPTSCVQNPRTKILFLFFESLSTCTKKKKKKKNKFLHWTPKNLLWDPTIENGAWKDHSLSLSLSSHDFVSSLEPTDTRLVNKSGFSRPGARPASRTRRSTEQRSASVACRLWTGGRHASSCCLYAGSTHRVPAWHALLWRISRFLSNR